MTVRVYAGLVNCGFSSTNHGFTSTEKLGRFLAPGIDQVLKDNFEIKKLSIFQGYILERNIEMYLSNTQWPKNTVRNRNTT